jgi:hypothetical protein
VFYQNKVRTRRKRVFETDSWEQCLNLRQRERGRAAWRKLHNDDLHCDDKVKSDDTSGAWGDEKCIHNLVEKPEVESQLGRLNVDGDKY